MMLDVAVPLVSSNGGTRIFLSLVAALILIRTIIIFVLQATPLHLHIPINKDLGLADPIHSSTDEFFGLKYAACDFLLIFLLTDLVT